MKKIYFSILLTVCLALTVYAMASSADRSSQLSKDDGALNKSDSSKPRTAVSTEVAQEPLDSPILPVFSGGFKMGYINSSGKIVIPPIYDGAYSFSENVALVFSKSSGYYYVDRQGDRVFGRCFAAASSFRCGRAVVKELGDDFYSIINKNGQAVAKLKKIIFAGASYENGLLLVQFNDQMFGFVDLCGNEAFTQRFKHAESFSEEYAVVQTENGRLGILSKTGNLKQTSVEYDMLRLPEHNAFHEGLLSVQNKEGVWGFIRPDGSTAIDFQFEDAGIFSEGRAPVRIGGKYGFIDARGKVVIDPQFDMAREFSSGVAAVIQDNNGLRDGYYPNKVGFCDKTGKLVIDYAYHDFYSANPFFNTITKCTEGFMPVWNYESDPWNGYITSQGAIVYQNFLSQDRPPVLNFKEGVLWEKYSV